MDDKSYGKIIFTGFSLLIIYNVSKIFFIVKT